MAKKRNAQDGWMALHQAHGRRIKALEAELKAAAKVFKMQVKAMRAMQIRIEVLEEPMLSPAKRQRTGAGSALDVRLALLGRKRR